MKMKIEDFHILLRLWHKTVWLHGALYFNQHSYNFRMHVLLFALISIK